jgi:hypothetical protein
MGAGQLMLQQYMRTGTTIILLTRDQDNSVMQLTCQWHNQYDMGAAQLGLKQQNQQNPPMQMTW